MTNQKQHFKGNSSRYQSKARRVLVSEFFLLKIKSINIDLLAESRTVLDDVFTRNGSGYYPNFPVLIQGNGEPWHIGNLYLTTKLERDSGYESKTYRGIADHLLDYLRFLEDQNLDFLHFPENDRLKVTYRYREQLLNFVNNAELSTSTAKSRINAVVNFYDGITKWGLVNQPCGDGIAFTRFNKELFVRREYGASGKIKITSHNLSLKGGSKQSCAEYIKDDEELRPLTIDEQAIVLKALHRSSREYQLMFYLALFTGARTQTIGTLRIRDFEGRLDSDGNLRLAIGSGTLIDTKKSKKMTLLIPGWLVKDIIIYSRCPEAIKRRQRSYYGESKDNYIFLSKSGVPYYTSRQEISSKSKKTFTSNTNISSRAQQVNIQDGAAIRAHIQQIILPRIFHTHPNFKKFKFHDLRATFGMNLMESQINHLGNTSTNYAIEYVQQRMGHTNKSTTLQYLNYKTRLEWKKSIQHDFEEELFKHVFTSMPGAQTS
ncbi:tyrosine-type recombinase/integrase [Pseudomonas sp. K1(2024)]|uniref:Tyrosine-type recombinase/integrase n=1 Tax=Pseudomonas boreofloridensis TaxID=3064348 RepID=A0ABV4Z2S0_9PSED|nr:site-specific integrase [Pseudomonas sp. K13]MDO7900670.1 site-specific integrase [Pseudomonas sp. K13]